MDAFISRKRRRISPPDDAQAAASAIPGEDEDSTDFKLALLVSLHPEIGQSFLLEILLDANGSVEKASQALAEKGNGDSPRKRPLTVGYQSSLSRFAVQRGSTASKKLSAKKGKTLHLYSPEDIENATPCSIIHNFLPPHEADALLRDMLAEAPTFGRDTFKLFDRVVESPHSICFYVDSWDEAARQRDDYIYNGSRITDIRRTLPEMDKAKAKVQTAVNAEIERRIERFQDGARLKYQSPREWIPNASFVNCYDGGAERVGYHSDQLTYVGPRAVIGSLSLGVAREFRVRRVVARDDDNSLSPASDAVIRADTEGQIAIHLPHNSLLVMHASMQEEWKHSIAPAQAIDPHPIAGNKRINITYRQYKESLHPRYTPRCRCNVPTVLRCVQRKKENRGRYMWMCHTSYTPGQEGCSFFQWAEFDDDGEPPWAKNVAGRTAENAARDEGHRE
ncbi:grf zinc finger domain-containing protein [Diplodia corticola]|uniref:Grf zinc finger domain-containing protein n=1 Tax=Diplodia corticola TaxID=236234 RepID=A0A1J9S9P1_9PEZI|nr:grf zinc finger domain-containing protein [Diplodia corticola]OJD37207.1 grf zinc finger domain-containing protein [Diplodia corticola]